MVSIAQERSAGSGVMAVIQHFKRYRGGAALFWCVLFGIALLYAAPETWRRDMQPTRDWFLAHPAIAGGILATYGSTAAITLFILLPIVVNAIASELATYMKAFFVVTLAIAFFDHWTDFPVNYALFSAEWPMPRFTAEPLSFLWWLVCMLLTQIWYTDILEVITAACAAGFLVCGVNTLRKPGVR